LARDEIDKAIQVYRKMHTTGRWTGGVHLMALAELLKLSLEP